MDLENFYELLMEEWKPFPTDKVNKSIEKKKNSTDVYNRARAKVQNAVKNYKTKSSQFNYKTSEKMLKGYDKHNIQYKARDKRGEHNAADKSARKRWQQTMVDQASYRSSHEDDKKQRDHNKKVKAQRDKIKNMARRADPLERAHDKPAVKGKTKGGFKPKKKSLDRSNLEKAFNKKSAKDMSKMNLKKYNKESMNYTEFLNEGPKHPDEKSREAPNKAVRQGNRLPMKNLKPMQRRAKGERAGSDGIAKSKKDETTKKVKGSGPNVQRNQAWGGESEQQYNPLKYRKIKSELKDKGGSVKVPGKPPYKSANNNYTVVRGKDKMDDWKPSESDMKAIEKMKSDKTDKDRAKAERAYKKKAKGYPKIEEERMDFTQFLESLKTPMFQSDGVPQCPPGYRFDKATVMCVPRTDKDDVTNEKEGQNGKKNLEPGNGPTFNTIGSHGQNGQPYAYEAKDPPNPWGYEDGGPPWVPKEDQETAHDEYYGGY